MTENMTNKEINKSFQVKIELKTRNELFSCQNFYLFHEKIFVINYSFLLIFIFQSLHSGCENDTPDLTGLHESIVDSDEEDLTHSMDVSFDFYFFT